MAVTGLMCAPMTMRPDEWARVKSLFEAVSAIAARRRTIQNGYWHVDVLQSDTDHDSLRDQSEFPAAAGQGTWRDRIFGEMTRFTLEVYDETSRPGACSSGSYGHVQRVGAGAQILVRQAGREDRHRRCRRRVRRQLRG